jgi:hypothetical protein
MALMGRRLPLKLLGSALPMPECELSPDVHLWRFSFAVFDGFARIAGHFQSQLAFPWRLFTTPDKLLRTGIDYEEQRNRKIRLRRFSCQCWAWAQDCRIGA